MQRRILLKYLKEVKIKLYFILIIYNINRKVRAANFQVNTSEVDNYQEKADLDRV